MGKVTLLYGGGPGAMRIGVSFLIFPSPAENQPCHRGSQSDSLAAPRSFRTSIQFEKLTDRNSHRKARPTVSHMRPPGNSTAKSYSNHRKIKAVVANCGDQQHCTELHSTVEGAEGAGQGGWFLTGIRLGPLRSDPPSPGHAIALAIKKGVPTEVAFDRQIPT